MVLVLYSITLDLVTLRQVNKTWVFHVLSQVSGRGERGIKGAADS